LVLVDDWYGEVPDQSTIFPTVKIVRSLNEVRVGDFDVVLLLGAEAPVPEGVFVLQISEGDTPTNWHRRYGYSLQRSSQPWSRALEFKVADGLDQECETLVATELWPYIEHEDEKSVVALVVDLMYGAPEEPEAREQVERSFHPLLLDSDGNASAGWLARKTDGREWWSLPLVVEDYVPWLRMLVKRWRAIDPNVFPESTGAYDTPDWQTSGELEAVAAIRALEAEKAQYELDHGTRLAAAEETLRLAVATAAESERRLLTETGEPLEAAVQDALETLGFEVAPQNGRGKPLREDFRIKQPGEDEWVALVEVKGLTNGASPSVFGQVVRHHVNFVAETGSPPDGVVVIVNHFRNDPPSGRARPFAGHPDEVAAFAENGYRIIDTRDLFIAARGVADGSVDAEVVRRTIVDGVGVLDLK